MRNFCLFNANAFRMRRQHAISFQSRAELQRLDVSPPPSSKQLRLPTAPMLHAMIYCALVAPQQQQLEVAEAD